MKTILMLGIIYISFPFSATAQKKQQLHSNISLATPETILKINPVEITEFARKNNINYLPFYEGLKDRAIYIVDRIIFTCVKMKTTEKRDLEKLKKSVDGLALTVNSKTYTSRIVASHGYKILITENSSENRLNFTAIDGSGHSSVLGVLEFNPSKRGDAKALLNNIVNTIGFD